MNGCEMRVFTLSLLPARKRSSQEEKIDRNGIFVAERIEKERERERERERESDREGELITLRGGGSLSRCKASKA